MSSIISFTSLFISIFLVQMGSGSLGPLDALGGVARGMTTGEIGLLGSAHFAGFFIGCYLTPRVIGRVGHARCFGAAAAVGVIGPLLHPVMENPVAWAGLRVLTGMAVASAYTVVEAWLQAKTENHNRARIYSVFRVVDLSGAIASQALIAVLDPATFAAYNIVAVFCCLCMLPLALTRRVAPEISAAPRLRPITVWRLSPSACMAVIVAAMTSASFRMIGPLYGIEKGLAQSELAVFLSASVIGAVIAQYPVGWIADKVDRRLVLIGLSASSIAACLWLAMMVPVGAVGLLYLGSALFGATAMPIYSVAAAYANDRAEKSFMVELSAALLFYYSLGAIFSPLISAQLIAVYGPDALFLFASAAHLALIGFAVYRMTRRRAAQPSVPYAYTPRTSMIQARLRSEAAVAEAEAGGADGTAAGQATTDREKAPR